MSTLDTNGRRRPGRRVLLCIGLVLLAALTHRGQTNLDVYFMARQGKDLLDGNWYRTTDFISMHDWLPFTHQKWAMCVLSYFAMDNFGVAGSQVGAVVLLALTGLAALYVANDLWPRRSGKWEAFPALALVAVTCSEFLTSFRPHCVAGILLLFELWALERHASGRMRPAALCGILSLCSFLIMWFHSTMWAMCLVPLLPYLCEFGVLARITKGSIVSEPCRKAPLLAAIPCMVLAACLNPMGPGEFRYMLLCAEALDPSVLWHVIEVQPFFPYAGSLKPVFVFTWICWMVLSGSVLFRKGRREREVFFWLGSAVMMLHAVRLTYQAMLFTWFAAAKYLWREDVPEDPDLARVARFEKAALYAAVAAAIVGQSLLSQPFYNEDIVTEWDRDRFMIESCAEVYDAIAADGGEGASVFGETMELDVFLGDMGLKPFMDCRAELYTVPDENGLSILDALYMVGQEDVQWDGKPLDEDGALSFLSYYGIDYVVAFTEEGTYGPAREGPEHGADERPELMLLVDAACTRIWSNDTFIVYRTPVREAANGA